MRHACPIDRTYEIVQIIGNTSELHGCGGTVHIHHRVFGPHRAVMASVPGDVIRETNASRIDDLSTSVPSEHLYVSVSSGKKVTGESGECLFYNSLVCGGVDDIRAGRRRTVVAQNFLSAQTYGKDGAE